jgi:hypothetical protein
VDVAKKIVYGSHAEEKFEILRRHGFIVTKRQIRERPCGSQTRSTRDSEGENARNGEFPRNMFCELSMWKVRRRLLW